MIRPADRSAITLTWEDEVRKLAGRAAALLADRDLSAVQELTYIAGKLAELQHRTPYQFECLLEFAKELLWLYHRNRGRGCDGGGNSHPADR